MMKGVMHTEIMQRGHLQRGYYRGGYQILACAARSGSCVLWRSAVRKSLQVTNSMLCP